jgi:hypothetical protein
VNTTSTNKTVIIAVLLHSWSLVLSDVVHGLPGELQPHDRHLPPIPGTKLSWNKVIGVTQGVVSNWNTIDLSPGVFSAGTSSASTSAPPIVGSSSCHPRTGSWEIEPVDARETFL